MNSAISGHVPTFRTQACLQKEAKEDKEKKKAYMLVQSNSAWILDELARSRRRSAAENKLKKSSGRRHTPDHRGGWNCYAEEGAISETSENRRSAPQGFDVFTVANLEWL